MGHSHWDTENAIKKQFPHAVIEKIGTINREKAKAEQSDHRKMADERQRSIDETTGAGKMSDRDRVLVGAIPDGGYWGLYIGIGKDAPDRQVFHHYSARGIQMGIAYVWEPEHYKPHDCAGCGKIVYQEPDAADRQAWICDKCRYELGFLWPCEAFSKWNSRYSGGTRRRGNGELQNEHLGGQMSLHGHPEIVNRLRAQGKLQIRRDENGNPTEYLVSSSRKDQERTLKEFNRIQKEAQRGLPESVRHKVGFLRHGGMTPE